VPERPRAATSSPATSTSPKAPSGSPHVTSAAGSGRRCSSSARSVPWCSPPGCSAGR
jgi:hypothetical protein